MKTTIQILIITASLTAPAFAASPPAITCPATAATTTATEPLTSIAIWNQTAGQPMESAAPPSLVPDTIHQSGTTLTSTWRLTPTPTERNYLFCGYGAANHFLLFDLAGSTSCTSVITNYSPTAPTNAGTTTTATCQ